MNLTLANTGHILTLAPYRVSVYDTAWEAVQAVDSFLC